jgi:uncharacterized protein DUF3307
MNPQMDAISPALAVVGAVFAALYAAHVVGDHWVQTSGQAGAKGAPTWAGRLADTAHVITLTITKLVALAALAAVSGWRPSLWQVGAALVVDAASHWWADRRTTLAALADRVGKGEFYALGAPRPLCDDNPTLGTGAYALDQSWHIAWLFIAALITAA